MLSFYLLLICDETKIMYIFTITVQTASEPLQSTVLYFHIDVVSCVCILDIPVGKIFVFFINLPYNIVFSPFQQAAHHSEVSEELRWKALQYGSECTTGYINLLEQVLQVRIDHHMLHEGRMRADIVCTVCVSS